MSANYDDLVVGDDIFIEIENLSTGKFLKTEAHIDRMVGIRPNRKMSVTTVESLEGFLEYGDTFTHKLISIKKQ